MVFNSQENHILRLKKPKQCNCKVCFHPCAIGQKSSFQAIQTSFLVNFSEVCVWESGRPQSSGGKIKISLVKIKLCGLLALSWIFLLGTNMLPQMLKYSFAQLNILWKSTFMHSCQINKQTFLFYRALLGQIGRDIWVLFCFTQAPVKTVGLWCGWSSLNYQTFLFSGGRTWTSILRFRAEFAGLATVGSKERNTLPASENHLTRRSFRDCKSNNVAMILWKKNE